ncbi:acetyl-CoA carboxylase [Boletus reticuloceps]|uniref:Acetyl-CoA carboxylase n=1 Tax=Boletus reticuloceps TaxID=495285 RepID=A0A8I2YT36_9AGAM|nr:acetyl-CoA carboxylase [Boletus reticuloceps]
MVGARPLADGGLLILLDGRSHSVYWREEVGALRLMVDSKTSLIEQENDPTRLRSPSPGKLIRLLVDSGDHINAGEQYAEIEVMKMYMPLVAAEDGIVQFVKQPSFLSTLSGCMPSKLEEGIRSAIDSAKSRGDAHEFPAVRIKKVLEHYVQDTILPQDRAMFWKQLAPLFDVLEKFMGGLKGHEVHTIASLLSAYESMEKLFGGNIKARVLSLREQNKDDLDKVAALVLSHTRAQSKSRLVLSILDYIKSSGLPVSAVESWLHKVLNDLAGLESNRQLLSLLKAREVLILGEMPSYEERLVQMEAILKASATSSVYGEQGTTNRTPSTEILRELSDSRYTVYDVLPSVFSHADPVVTLAAFEVYVCRAYRAYSLLSIDYEEGDGPDDIELPSALT